MAKKPTNETAAPVETPAAVDIDRPAVSERGEIVLELGGQELTLRPSYEAIEAFEGLTDKGLLQLAGEALNRRLKLGETAQVVTECVRAWGREAENKNAAGATAVKVGRLIQDGPGLFAVLGQIAGMLALASTGGYDSSGKLKAAAGTTTTPLDTDAA